jgi:hypothetical protein
MVSNSAEAPAFVQSVPTVAEDPTPISTSVSPITWTAAAPTTVFTNTPTAVVSTSIDASTSSVTASSQDADPTTTSMPDQPVLTGSMKFVAAGVTALDVEVSVTYALSVELSVSSLNHITVSVTQSGSRRLQAPQESSLRRLATAWDVSFSIEVPDANTAATLQNATEKMSTNNADFGKTLQKNLYSRLESSGRDPVALTKTFAVASFKSELRAKAPSSPAENGINTRDRNDQFSEPDCCKESSVIFVTLFVCMSALSRNL